jgi:hypothetical protein
MRRHTATTWLIAIFVVALGAMGAARDLHAASHALSAEHSACVAALTDTSPASLPLDSSSNERDCPTCDLLAVLSKSALNQTTVIVVEPAPSIAAVDEVAPSDPVVVQSIDDNRTRGPPASFRCAV